MGYGYSEYGAMQQQVPSDVLTAPLAVRNREIVPNLHAQRQELVSRIAKIDALLQILEKHPEFTSVLDLSRELIGF